MDTIFTFITVASSIYVILFTLWITLIFRIFASLTPFERHRAKIHIDGTSAMIYILSVSWIVSRFIS